MKTDILIVIAALAAAACSPTQRAGSAHGLTFDEFVDVMVALQQAQPHQRDSILKKHATDERQLRAFVQAGAADPVRLAGAFDSIQTRLDRVRIEAEAMQ